MKIQQNTLLKKILGLPSEISSARRKLCPFPAAESDRKEADRQ